MTSYADGYDMAQSVARDIRPNSRMMQECNDQLALARIMLLAYRRAGHREYCDCELCGKEYRIIGYCEGLIRARESS